MNSNLPVNFQDVDNILNEDDLHALAGLVSGGVNEDGEIDWIGNRACWDRFDELCEQRNDEIEDQQFKYNEK